MADLTTNVQTLFDSAKAARVVLSDDGTSGDPSDNATLLNADGLSGAPAGGFTGAERVLIQSIKWNIDNGENITLQWDSTSGVDIAVLTGTGNWENLNWKNQGNVVDSGATGDITLLTSAPVAFTIMLNVKKYQGYEDTPNPRFGPPITGDMTQP
tara:strand:- start:29 stop:493 length:465 start_codon:yes stop_codon:yes gene_type:complete